MAIKFLNVKTDEQRRAARIASLFLRGKADDYELMQLPEGVRKIAHEMIGDVLAERGVHGAAHEHYEKSGDKERIAFHAKVMEQRCFK